MAAKMSSSEKASIDKIEARLGPVGAGHHNSHRTAHILEWERQQKEKAPVESSRTKAKTRQAAALAAFSGKKKPSDGDGDETSTAPDSIRKPGVKANPFVKRPAKVDPKTSTAPDFIRKSGTKPNPFVKSDAKPAKGAALKAFLESKKGK